MTRSLLLPTLLLPFFALACSSNVVESNGTGGSMTSGTTSSTGTSSTGTSSTTGTGAGGTSGTTTSSTSSSGSTTTSSSGSTTSGVGGAGGGGACQGFIDVDEDNEPLESMLTASCPGEWGSTTSSTADGFLEQGGPAGAPAYLTIAGCASNGNGKLVLTVIVSDLNPTLVGTYANGTVTYVDPGGASYDTSINPFKLVVTEFEDTPGGVADGTFAVEVSNGGSTLAHSLTGTFHVCHVPDEDVP
jgi:hypothetical protein